MDVESLLSEIVGEEGVSYGKETTGTTANSRESAKGSPSYRVRARNTGDVQSIIRLANELKIPVSPSSSGVHFRKGRHPRSRSILLDLSGMNRIKELDESNRAVHLEPGVNWADYSDYLETHGYRSVMPLLPHGSRSVTTDWLEREQPTAHPSEYAEPLLSMQVIWGNGEEFVTGSASVNDFRQPGCLADGTNPMGPGPLDFHRFLQGAQGTLGIVTWAIVKCEEIPTRSRTYFLSANNITDLIDPLYKVLRRRIGIECLVLNSLNLATILAKGKSTLIGPLMKVLPPWTVVLVLSAFSRRPEEKLAYESEALAYLHQNHFPGIKLSSELSGVPGLGVDLPEMLRKPWPANETYWKHTLKGASLDLDFMTTLDRIDSLVSAVIRAAVNRGFPEDHIGCYVQPVENGRACQLEFNFYHDPSGSISVRTARSAYTYSAKAVLQLGAYFNRPYGSIARMVFSEADGYVVILKRLKKLFDPKNILNPGHLCF